MIEMDVVGGGVISETAREACVRAKLANQPVQFLFNSVRVTVMPGDTSETIERLWSALLAVNRLRHLLKAAVAKGWIPVKSDASLACNIHEKTGT